jgi:subtilase family serine protease
LVACAAAAAMAFSPVAAAGSARVGPAATTAGPSYAGAGTYYAVGKRACKPAKSGYSACFADRRVLVKKGTAGARAFKISSGAIADGTIGPAGGLTPGDLATAYGLTTTGGSGQTLAIVDAYNDPNLNADLQTFDTEYGLATCSTSNGCLDIVNESGASSPLAPNDTTGWSVETSLDVETAHSICQGCKILLVEANTNKNTDLGTAVNTAVTLGATEVSNSYGGLESGSTTAIQADYNHPDVVITASAGDDGYYSFDDLAADNLPNTPAAYPSVVAVGGTSLYLAQNGTRQSETVWNDNGPQDYYEQLTLESLGATGGGCSTKFTAQGWQSHESDWASTGCGTHRLVSDVSADADYLTGLDVYDSYTCASGCVSSAGWYTIGGTSLASPIIAAVYALAGGAHGVKDPAVTLYGHPGATYDVTTGGNGWCDGETSAQCSDPNLQGDGIVDCAYTSAGAVAAGDLACDAGTGYDGPTGVGTPNGLTDFEPTGPAATISGPKSIAVNTAGTWKATATDPFPGGTATRYTWSWGDGTANTVTSTGSASHTYTTAGTKTITLTVSDNYGVTGPAATYTVTVTS